MERTITFRVRGNREVTRTFNTENRFGRQMARNLVRKLVEYSTAGTLEKYEDNGPCGPGCVKSDQGRITHSLCPMNTK